MGQKRWPNNFCQIVTPSEESRGINAPASLSTHLCGSLPGALTIEASLPGHRTEQRMGLEEQSMSIPPTV